MKFNYFKSYCTENHVLSVLEELKEFIKQNDNNIDSFFEQLAKNIAFTEIMRDFYRYSDDEARSKTMQKYFEELINIRQNILEEIKNSKEDLDMVKLKEFIDIKIKDIKMYRE